MSWKWILGVAAIILIAGAPTNFVLLPSTYIWVSQPLAMILGSVLLTKKAPGGFFKHGFLAGLIGIVANGFLAMTFGDRSVEWWAFLAFVMVYGSLSGALQGGLTLLAARLLRRGASRRSAAGGRA